MRPYVLSLFFPLNRQGQLQVAAEMVSICGHRVDGLNIGCCKFSPAELSSIYAILQNKDVTNVVLKLNVGSFTICIDKVRYCMRPWYSRAEVASVVKGMIEGRREMCHEIL